MGRARSGGLKQLGQCFSQQQIGAIAAPHNQRYITRWCGKSAIRSVHNNWRLTRCLLCWCGWQGQDRLQNAVYAKRKRKLSCTLGYLCLFKYIAPNR